MDSTGLDILSHLVRLSQRKQVCLQWIPSHVGVSGNEAADEVAGRGCDLPNPSSTILTHTENHSFQRNKMNLTWRNPPAHHCYESWPIYTVQEFQGSSDGLGAPQKRSPALYDFCTGGKVFLYLSLLSPCFSCSSSGLLGHFPATVV
ncbi:RNase H domain-containing protein [Trichonephila clavipes]|nr:RNase H domain-containing protein [Trichonephila clavipes]